MRAPVAFAFAVTALLARPARAEPPAPRAPEAEQDEYRALRFRFGIALTGAGVLSAVMGGSFGVRTFVDKAKIGAHCTRAARCDVAGYTLGTEAQDFALVSTVTLGIGLAAVTAGTIFILTGAPRRRAGPVTSAWIAPQLRGFAAGLAW